MVPSIHIALLNWNQARLLEECLESLGAVSDPPFEIDVVDNASTEAADLETLSHRGRGFHLIRAPSNLGFSGGNNLGIEHALRSGASVVMLLNTDTTVEPDFLRRMVDAMEGRERVGALGPTIRFHGEPDRIWYEGGELDQVDGRPAHVPFGRVCPGRLEGPPRPTRFVTGCCFMAGAAAWRSVGLLCDDFFFRWEDTDWCARAGRAGLTHLHVPAATVYHKTGFRARWADGTAVGLYFETRNRLLWVRRHVEAGLKVRFYYRAVRAMLRVLVDLATAPCADRSLCVRALGAGLVDFLAGRYGPAPRFLQRG